MEYRQFVKFPVYGYKILIVLTDDINRSRYDMKADLGHPEGEVSKYVDGLHSYVKCEPDGVIFFTNESTIGTIAHECFHAVWRMMSWIGAKPENEVMAYHLGYLVDEAMKLKGSTKEK